MLSDIARASAAGSLVRMMTVQTVRDKEEDKEAVQTSALLYELAQLTSSSYDFKDSFISNRASNGASSRSHDIPN